MHSVPKKGIISTKNLPPGLPDPGVKSKDPLILKNKPDLFKISRFLIILTFLFIPNYTAQGAETHKSFNLDHNQPGKGNIFNLFFGPPPPMATERGTLIIDAFEDKNGNGRKDDGETDIDKGISCSVDGIEYPLPAFIPGLTYDNSYDVLCQGGEFVPEIPKRNILIERRGQILRVALPCQRIQTPSPPD
jgi:hypothetical protein